MGRKKITKIMIIVLGAMILTGCSSVVSEDKNLIECNKTFVDENNLTIGNYNCDKLVCEKINSCNYNNLI